ncbi:MAG: hypothetical protein PHH05_07840 [Syntrophaceticus sp.]|nr:hypothetical protein [Syntrophaceticus sp.]MDD3315387.1 hypothetical protein [Syntrophaceticus sp.]
MMQNDDKANVDPKVKEAILEAASDGRISCPEARDIAFSLGVDLKVIGDACDELDIKLYGCALGCF